MPPSKVTPKIDFYRLSLLSFKIDKKSTLPHTTNLKEPLDRKINSSCKSVKFVCLSCGVFMIWSLKEGGGQPVKWLESARFFPLVSWVSPQKQQYQSCLCIDHFQTFRVYCQHIRLLNSQSWFNFLLKWLSF